MPQVDGEAGTGIDRKPAGRAGLAGRVALVTGGCGGIGSAIVRRMIAEGMRVAVGDIDLPRAKTLLGTIDTDGADARTYRLDVTDRDGIARVVADVEDWAGPVDVLVNAAGVNSHHPALDLPEEAWDRIIDVNLKGTFLMSQAVARGMKPNDNASIINISSTSAEVARATSVHYAASKGGVRQLTKGFAVALAPQGIRVNAIAPGPVLTDLNKVRLSDPQERARSLARVALGRMGLPTDIAGVAVFLASEDAAFITGASINVDGGLLAMR